MVHVCGETKETGVVVPEVILPAKHVDLCKWAVVACDQWTQDRRYWEETAAIAGDAPSTLNLVFPEIYLEDGGKAARIRQIHETMRSDLANGVFAPPESGFVYVERETTGGLRQGLIAAVDLECYDWKPEARPLIRASEGTIEERLPPRMEIRRAAPLELPHVMLLIDDEADTLFGSLAGGTGPFAYDTELMQGGGRVRGRFVRDPARVMATLATLARSSPERYGSPEPFLFAVGDGNHSLATAKAVWEEYKTRHTGGLAGQGPRENPLRYALVEIVNIYSPALRFEPIHRVLLGPSSNTIDPSGAIDLSSFKIRSLTSHAALSALVRTKGNHTRFGVMQGNRYLLAEAASPLLATAILDPELEKVRAAHPALTLDYIHGEQDLFALCREGTATGFLLPPFEKKGLFDTIAKTGPLPRKSFSMGEARDKRYYLEARRINA
ncbi:MAG: DUF1015 domain-containing protein [Spirochaetaceae bacterium]|jgi:hypothetical protein|nr:DUF1015 domain-containing protein [Spirochaetaceae bacterium]